MTNALTTWNPESGEALPAYLADALGGLGSNIPDRMTVPSLSYEGKTWAVVKDGNRTKLERKNADGDMEPIPIMRCVVLNFNSERGRAFYPGLYNPQASTAPKCWSADGKAPDASVTEKESALCQGCPQSIKGSKIQDGKEMVACSSHRMVAIAPAFDLDADPLRLKIAVTSDYDKDIVEHGWFAFRQYADYLKARGITHTALVVTKIKFDNNVAYPKLLFALDRLLEPGEVEQVKLLLASPKTAELLAEKWTAAGTNGTPTDQSDIAPATDPAADPSTIVIDQTPTEVQRTTPNVSTGWDARAAAAADGWVQHPDSAPHGYKGQEVLAWADIEARYPAPAAPAPEPAAPPPPAPEPIPAPAAHDPHAAAVADGWVQHPDSAPHAYRGQEVLTWDDVHARYPGNAPASAATGGAGSGGATSAQATPAGDGSGPTATTAASPSEGVPPEVQSLLSKWTS